MAPMAMPISARVSTGASLMPSPTKASFAFFGLSCSSFSTFADLIARAAARCEPRQCQAPWRPDRPRALASPVSMTVFSTPACFSCCDGFLGMGLDDIGDDDVTGIFAVDGHVNDGADAVAVVYMECPCSVHELCRCRRATSCPSTLAVTPLPLISSMSVTRLRSISLP